MMNYRSRNWSVFFNVSSQLENEIKSLMEQEGFMSKAEFFRFLVKFFKYNRRQDEIEFYQAASQLEETLKTLEKKGLVDRPPSLEGRLADV